MRDFKAWEVLAIVGILVCISLICIKLFPAEVETAEIDHWYEGSVNQSYECDFLQCHNEGTLRKCFGMRSYCDVIYEKCTSESYMKQWGFVNCTFDDQALECKCYTEW